jgi:hypothetical protein
VIALSYTTWNTADRRRVVVLVERAVADDREVGSRDAAAVS